VKVIRETGFDVVTAVSSHLKCNLYTITLFNLPVTALTRDRQSEVPF
jgi:hypothetical protein